MLFHLFCCYDEHCYQKSEKENEDGVAQIETTTAELKPPTKSAEKPASVDNPEPSPISEKEEPLYKSSLRVMPRPKPKVSSNAPQNFISNICVIKYPNVNLCSKIFQ